MAACLISVVKTIISLPNAVAIELDEGLLSVAFMPPEILEHPSNADLKYHTKKLPLNVISTLENAPHEYAIEFKVCKDSQRCKLKGCYEPHLCKAALNLSRIPCLMEQPCLQIRLLQNPNQSMLADLTTREKEILKMLLEGYPQKKIALLAQISAFTVNDHLKSIYRKIGVSSKGEVLSKARKWIID